MSTVPRLRHMMQDTPSEPNHGPIGNDATDGREDDRHERSSFESQSTLTSSRSPSRFTA
jgi:hypothetical protein